MAAYDQILAYISASVAELSSISNTALYKKIAEAIGLSIDNTITEINNTQSNINNILYNQRFGKGGFYITSAKAFQYGDTLTADPITGYPMYAVIDATKQIIAQASYENSVIDGYQKLVLKVAKLNSNTKALEPLTPSEYSAFASYMNNFVIDGIYIDFVSLPPNIFGFNAEVNYYTAYDLTTLKNNVSSALQNFKTNFQFNSKLFVNDLPAYLVANVQGLRNVFLSETTITDAFGNTIPFTNDTLLSNGYFNYPANILDNLNYVKL